MLDIFFYFYFYFFCSLRGFGMMDLKKKKLMGYDEKVVAPQLFSIPPKDNRKKEKKTQ